MKVKCIKRYNDVSLHKTLEIGAVLEVDEARANYLIHEGMVEIIAEEAEDAMDEEEG